MSTQTITASPGSPGRPAHVPDHVWRNRPNKIARGMTATAYRQGRNVGGLSIDVIRLSVFGTCDRLNSYRAQIPAIARPTVCPCCGGKSGKLALTDAGRRYLARVSKRTVRPLPLL